MENRKHGRPVGCVPVAHDNHFWYDLCALYRTKFSHSTHHSFLSSTDSGMGIDSTKSTRQSFKKKLIKYDCGELIRNTLLRDRGSKYPFVEEKLVNYINIRQTLYTKDKTGLSWVYISQKLDEWASMGGLIIQTSVPHLDSSANVLGGIVLCLSSCTVKGENSRRPRLQASFQSFVVGWPT